MYNQLKRSRASLNGALSWRLGHRPGDQSRSSLSACLRQCFAKRSHGVPGGKTVSAHKCFATDKFVRPDWYTVLQLPRDPSIWTLQVECCNTSLANMLCIACNCTVYTRQGLVFDTVTDTVSDRSCDSSSNMHPQVQL